MKWSSPNIWNVLLGSVFLHLIKTCNLILMPCVFQYLRFYFLYHIAHDQIKSSVFFRKTSNSFHLLILEKCFSVKRIVLYSSQFISPYWFSMKNAFWHSCEQISIHRLLHTQWITVWVEISSSTGAHTLGDVNGDKRLGSLNVTHQQNCLGK